MSAPIAPYARTPDGRILKVDHVFWDEDVAGTGERALCLALEDPESPQGTWTVEFADFCEPRWTR